MQRSGRTVQGTLEQVLKRLTGERRPVLGSGRTDRGVHATGQVAAVTVPAKWTATELRRAMNALLPDDIWIESATPVRPDFNPRYAATSREYHYRLGLEPLSHSPFHRRFCWGIERQPDLEVLQHLAALLPGDRSFAAFAKAGQEHRGDRCNLTAAEWVVWEPLGISFRVQANRFLHHMVRYLVGTMVSIALGGRDEAHFMRLLEGNSDKHLVTSPPAPAQGLYLTGVSYPSTIFDLSKEEFEQEDLSD